MTPDNPTPPPSPPMNASQRRAAEMRAGAGRQAELKQEAAERRAARAEREVHTPAKPLGRNRSRHAR